MILTDKSIRALCVGVPEPMIDPFSETVSGNNTISYGLCSAGYDLRLAPEIYLFQNMYGEIIDPKSFKDEKYRNRILRRIDEEGDRDVIIPANSYVLGCSYEYLRIPRHLKGRCVGKSTLARCAVLINTTPLEPGWCGKLTIEIGNCSPCPVRIPIMEGIAQLEFEELNGLPEADYAQKPGGGKYQNQLNVTPARVW